MIFDLIIKGGWVIDGSGGPPYRADVAILESMIADVGRLDEAESARSWTQPGATSSPVSSTPMSTATSCSWRTRFTFPPCGKGSPPI